jgi:hypothetical protein
MPDRRRHPASLAASRTALLDAPDLVGNRRQRSPSGQGIAREMVDVDRPSWRAIWLNDSP